MGFEGELDRKISLISQEWEKQDSRKSNERKSARIIFDKIHGAIQINGYLVDILDRPPMQRLRWIKQLGASEMLYPNGSHSRFEHSLGTYCISKQMILYLKKNHEDRIKLVDEYNVMTAALVHDVGHLCFSHTGELFLDYYSDINQLIQKFELKKEISIHEYLGYKFLSCKYFNDLVDLINAQYRVGLDLEVIKNIIIGYSENPETQFLADIVHGPIDADRVDYLLRDAYSVGFPNIVDLHRLMNTITIIEIENEGRMESKLAIEKKGLRAVESLFLARNRLKPILYEHHVTRISEEMLIRIMKACLESPLMILGLDDYSFFCLAQNDENYKERFEDYKNRKLFKRFLFLHCSDEQVANDVSAISIQEKTQIEEDISDSIFDESNYCIMITKKSKEISSIGNIYLISENREPEKALISIERLYSKEIMYSEPIDTSKDNENADRKEIRFSETDDIRFFAPWDKISQIDPNYSHDITQILSDNLKISQEEFNVTYLKGEYKGFSVS